MTEEATLPDPSAAAASAAAAGADAGASSTPAKAADAGAAAKPDAAAGAKPDAAAAQPDPAKPATPPPFKVPDAYKDKPWAAKIKTEEDLFKQIDTLDALKGKKQVVPDFKTATPAEIEQYYAQTRPENKDAYQFGENTDPALKGTIADSMFKNGISATQANAIIKDYQAAEAKAVEGMFSAEGMNAELEKAFGAEWKEVGGLTARILKQNLNAGDAAMMDKLPNQFLGLVYRMANNLIKGYGIKESGAHTEAGAGAQQPADVAAVRADLLKQLLDLQKRPHTAEEKQALIDKRNATYETGKK